MLFDYALGAVLEQKDDEGEEHVVAYASKLLNNLQVKWDSYHKELAAIIFATQQFRPYLYGRKFYVLTDSHSLKFSHHQNKQILYL